MNVVRLTTYMRTIYGLDRFSEDLHFTLLKADVRIFLRDSSQLSEWSEEFFLYWFSQIKFV